MKIAITGAQGTGKSTLLEALKKQPNIMYEYTFIDEITRRMIKKGLKINEQGGNTTQLLIVGEHIKNTLYEKSIMDRCVLDGFVYTQWLFENKQVNKWVRDFSYEAYREYIQQYDHIFYIEPEFELEDDGVRSADVDFRNQILDIFREEVSNVSVWAKNFTHLTGTVQERVNQINSIVKW